jgi:hypothetical protein
MLGCCCCELLGELLLLQGSLQASWLSGINDLHRPGGEGK